MSQLQPLAALDSGLTLVDGTPVVSSLALAHSFSKKHKHVLDAIRTIMADCPEHLRGPNFRPTFSEVPGPNGATRKDPAFLLTRDAFTLLAMSFTGKQAMRWKLRYIEAFNAMETELRTRAAAPALPEVSQRLDEAIRAAGRAVLAISPDRLVRIQQVVRYADKGLTSQEIATLMDIHKDTVWKYLKLARKLGLL